MSVAVIYGVGSIFAIAMIASLIVSILLRFTSLTESSLTYVVMIVSFYRCSLVDSFQEAKGKSKVYS